MKKGDLVILNDVQRTYHGIVWRIVECSLNEDSGGNQQLDGPFLITPVFVPFDVIVGHRKVADRWESFRDLRKLDVLALGQEYNRFGDFIKSAVRQMGEE